MDYISLPLTSQGNNAALVVVDNFSGWIECYPTATQSAQFTCLSLFKWLSHYGLPHTISCNMGTHFNAAEVKNMMITSYGIKLYRRKFVDHYNNSTKPRKYHVKDKVMVQKLAPSSADESVLMQWYGPSSVVQASGNVYRLSDGALELPNRIPGNHLKLYRSRPRLRIPMECNVIWLVNLPHGKEVVGASPTLVESGLKIPENEE
jgi:hypothetical protein